MKDSIKNKPFFMKNAINRLGEIFNFYSEQYTLLGSITGTGKTSFIDHNILEMLESFFLLPQEEKDKVHLEFLYYSMERKKKYKYAKFASWKMFKDSKLRIPADIIINRNGELQEDQCDWIIENHGEWLNQITQYIDMRESQKSVKQISTDIALKAKKIGLFFESDSSTIYKFGEYHAFFDEGQYIDTPSGRRKYFIIEHNGIEHILYENDKIFIPFKPTLFFVIIDHVGKVKRMPGANKKDTLDALDDEMCAARDNYMMSPICISQFNRAISATERLKYNQGDLDPVLEDFKDTGNMTESADLVLSVFEPGRYKSWDAKGNYKGINIRDAMVTPRGISRSRSIHVLKHSTGIAGVSQILRFTGESMHFQAMPVPEDVDAIQAVYKEIAQGY